MRDFLVDISPTRLLSRLFREVGFCPVVGSAVRHRRGRHLRRAIAAYPGGGSATLRVFERLPRGDSRATGLLTGHGAGMLPASTVRKGSPR